MSWLLRRVLHGRFAHSVRDAYRARKLDSKQTDTDRGLMDLVCRSYEVWFWPQQYQDLEYLARRT